MTSQTDREHVVAWVIGVLRVINNGTVRYAVDLLVDTLEAPHNTIYEVSSRYCDTRSTVGLFTDPDKAEAAAEHLRKVLEAAGDVPHVVVREFVLNPPESTWPGWYGCTIGPDGTVWQRDAFDTTLTGGPLYDADLPVLGRRRTSVRRPDAPERWYREPDPNKWWVEGEFFEGLGHTPEEAEANARTLAGK